LRNSSKPRNQGEDWGLNDFFQNGGVPVFLMYGTPLAAVALAGGREDRSGKGEDETRAGIAEGRGQTGICRWRCGATTGRIRPEPRADYPLRTDIGTTADGSRRAPAHLQRDAGVGYLSGS
jgi:hypothetical protein